MAVNPRVDESPFLKVSIFHLLVRSLINTVSMGSVCVEQMAQASLGEMKNANLSNAAKTNWLEISLGGGLNSHLKTHLAGTHTFLLSSTLCTILILLYLRSSHSALSLSASWEEVSAVSSAKHVVWLWWDYSVQHVLCFYVSSEEGISFCLLIVLVFLFYFFFFLQYLVYTF